ncbi:MAG: response regulator [Acidimicrobiales bacterium]|nr:response regulator [Acidimicrobiales bacterium]
MNIALNVEFTILVIDDNEVNLELFKQFLTNAGYKDLHFYTDGRQALDQLSAIAPDLIILDLHMPHMDGLEFLERLGESVASDDHIPVMVVTADATSEAKTRALTKGANDYLIKPLESREVTLRVANLLETRRLQLGIREQKRSLERTVLERTNSMEIARSEVLARLAYVAEYRDDDTGNHTQRIGNISAAIAKKAGLSDSMIEIVRKAAPLHDLGKVCVPDRILLKAGKLTDEEFEENKKHTTVGAEILEGGEYRLLQVARDICLSHHEHYDGTGYPQGLSGADIALEARICSIADVFDTMTHDRPYRKALSIEEAIDEIRKQSGKHFDPELVDIFLELIENGEISTYSKAVR